MTETLTDIHSHSFFSPDGHASLEDMIKQAILLGVKYYGISEHFDYETLYSRGKTINVKEYLSTARALQEKYKDKICILVGAEFGFIDLKEGEPFYRDLVENYSFDYIINSVHCKDLGGDYCLGGPFKQENGTLNDKRSVYKEYFSIISKSLDAFYPYDVVGHVSYVMRYAPYEDKSVEYKDYADEIDEILLKVIQKGKILEVNSKDKGDGFIPKEDVLRRYFELGGRKITFGSDAHDTSRIIEKRQLVISTLKKIGFEYITIPNCGKEIQILI